MGDACRHYSDLQSYVSNANLMFSRDAHNTSPLGSVVLPTKSHFGA